MAAKGYSKIIGAIVSVCVVFASYPAIAGNIQTSVAGLSIYYQPYHGESEMSQPFGAREDVKITMLVVFREGVVKEIDWHLMQKDVSVKFVTSHGDVMANPHKVTVNPFSRTKISKDRKAVSVQFTIREPVPTDLKTIIVKGTLFAEVAPRLNKRTIKNMRIANGAKYQFGPAMATLKLGRRHDLSLSSDKRLTNVTKFEFADQYGEPMKISGRSWGCQVDKCYRGFTFDFMPDKANVTYWYFNKTHTVAEPFQLKVASPSLN